MSPAKAPSQRQLRVGEAVRHALADVIERGQIRDPVLESLAVTVTEVRMSPDLRHAQVYVLPLGGGEAKVQSAVAALTRAAPFLRHKIAGTVRLKFAPELSFRPDATFAEAQRIEDLLRAPEVARDLDRPAVDDRASKSGEDGT